MRYTVRVMILFSEVGDIRTGVYGGSFDPPHQGHLLAAMTALEKAGLDRVLLLPCGDIPCAGEIRAPAKDRTAMLALMAEDCRDLEICTLEAEQKERLKNIYLEIMEKTF